MRKLLLSMAFGLALAGCSGDDDPDAFRPPEGPVATQIAISSSAASMPSDGSAPVIITVLARDAHNVLIADVPVSFSATSGALVVGTQTTGASGEVTATLTTPGDTSLRTITVTATSGSLTASTLVQVVAPASIAPPSVSSSNSSKGSFKASAPGTARSSAVAGTPLQSVVQQSNGALEVQSATFNVSAPCRAENLQMITAVADASAVSTSGAGTVLMLFADLDGNPLGSGTTISASASGDGISLGSEGTFTVPCTTDPTVYPFTIAKTGAATTGTLTITVTSPSGLQSVLSYPIL